MHGAAACLQPMGHELPPGERPVFMPWVTEPALATGSILLRGSPTYLSAPCCRKCRQADCCCSIDSNTAWRCSNCPRSIAPTNSAQTARRHTDTSGGSTRAIRPCSHRGPRAGVVALQVLAARPEHQVLAVCMVSAAPTTGPGTQAGAGNDTCQRKDAGGGGGIWVWVYVCTWSRGSGSDHGGAAL